MEDVFSKEITKNMTMNWLPDEGSIVKNYWR